MSKSILVNKDFLYNKLEQLINIAKQDSTSKIAISKMKSVRNQIHHSLQDTTELLEALDRIAKVRWFGNALIDSFSLEFEILYKALGGNIDE